MGFPGGPGCNLSVGSVARREKRTGRDYLGRWMQDANNDEGHRTNDVRLFVHSSHSVDRMSPSALWICSVYKIAAGLSCHVAGKRERPLVIIRRDNLLHVGRCELFQSIIDCATHHRIIAFYIFFKMPHQTGLRFFISLINLLSLSICNSYNIYQFLRFFFILYSSSYLRDLHHEIICTRNKKTHAMLVHTVTSHYLICNLIMKTF